jgi:hypothetical protein
MRLDQLDCRSDVPDGWFHKQSITLLAPDGQANMIVSSEPLDPILTTDHYAQIQADLLRREFPGFREHEVGRVVLGSGHEAVWRAFSWVPPDGVSVTQLQVYVADRGRGYTATGTTPTNNWNQVEAVFHRMVSSLSFGAAPMETSGPVNRFFGRRSERS